MRIIIEIEANNVGARADRSDQQRVEGADRKDQQLLASSAVSTIDAGSAPLHLLGELPPKHSTKKPAGSLNPLRAGEAAAKEGVPYAAQLLTESVETVDAGGAPKPAATKPVARRATKKK